MSSHCWEVSPAVPAAALDAVEAAAEPNNQQLRIRTFGISSQSPISQYLAIDLHFGAPYMELGCWDLIMVAKQRAGS